MPLPMPPPPPPPMPMPMDEDAVAADSVASFLARELDEEDGVDEEEDAAMVWQTNDQLLTTATLGSGGSPCACVLLCLWPCFFFFQVGLFASRGLGTWGIH